MPKKQWPITFVLVMAGILAGSGAARAQLSDTTAFLAHVSNQYRVVPNVVYHVANNHKTSSTCICQLIRVAPRRYL